MNIVYLQILNLSIWCLQLTAGGRITTTTTVFPPPHTTTRFHPSARCQFKRKNPLASIPLSRHSLSLRGGESGETSSSSSSSSSVKKRKRKRHISHKLIDDDAIITTEVKVKVERNRHSMEESELHENEHTNDNNDDNNNHDIPTIKAILLPRKISIPQIIRLVSVFGFTSSLLESLRTSGLPRSQAVKSILRDHGIQMHSVLSGNAQTETESDIGSGSGLDSHSHSHSTITPLDEYLANKICQGENNALPPKYFPSTLPLLGLLLSVAFHVSFTTLFPTWFVEFNAWVNYDRVDVGINAVQNANANTNNLQRIKNCLDNGDGDEDKFYQSQFANRNRAPHGKNKEARATGLAVLVQSSRQEKEMANANDGNGNGKSESIQWLFQSESSDHPESYFIEVGQRRLYVKLDINSKGMVLIACQDGGPNFYLQEEISDLIERGSRGLSNKDELEYANIRYGFYNDLSLPIPTVRDAFVSRISSPLAVLQLMGKILTALEENFVPAMMSMATTLGHHYMNAKKSIVSAKELSIEIQGNVENVREQKFWTLRPLLVPLNHNHNGSKKKRKKEVDCDSTWLDIPSSRILPGDVFYLPSCDTVLPVDALILEGNCIAQEAVITGESVPQAKVAVEPNDSQQEGDSYSSDKLSMDLKHRNSVLFAGTTVMHCDSEGGDSELKHLPKAARKSSSPVKCLALRTGSYSSKGEIVRALSKRSGLGGAISTFQSERDSVRLIVFLSSFAALACASLFLPSKDVNGLSPVKKTSGFRRVIQCTRIAVASIPSDLPLALNSILHSCAATLRKEADVVCASPGSLLSASQIDMIIFDKTGTLTSDTQSMKNIVDCSGMIVERNPLAEIVLAGCHSLSSVKGGTSNLIGDPLDKVSLEYSRWTFNSTDQSAIPPDTNVADIDVNGDMVGRVTNTQKMWQIKAFPFDPTRRRSAALLLVQHEYNDFRLWKVVKGAPDGMKPMLNGTHTRSTNGKYMTKEEFLENYERITENLGSKGIRSVTLAAKDVTNSPIGGILFPEGLPKKYEEILQRLRNAKKVAKHQFHISDFETDMTDSMTFIGFACFDASVRESTPRIIKDIKDSGIGVSMLTGDGSAAALSVARQCNFFDKKKCTEAYTLVVDQNKHLKWVVKGLRKNDRLRDEYKFNTKISQTIIAKQRSQKCTIVITGGAFSLLLDPLNRSNLAANYVLENLHEVAVICRSSPQMKQQVLSTLKSRCGKKIMMCGDGVNDISAMKTADISAALLNGYGSEEGISQCGVDMENERRKMKLKFKKIGRSKDTAEFGTEGHSRIKRKMEEALNYDAQNPQVGMDAIVKIMKEEYTRAKELRKGGAAAARILQQDDSLRKSMLDKSTNSNENCIEIINGATMEDCAVEIKPGEASLAAPFTFLRPCIDGADAIVRVGVAAAAYLLSSQRYIALNSLMACYNLATLYRDGFRYGKHMWNVELGFIMLMDQGQCDISSMPRSRIPRIRPNDTIFSPAVTCSILLQSAIHLFVLTKGVHGAKTMQMLGSGQEGGLRIRFKQSMLKGMNLPMTEADQGGGSIFGRKIFRPNLVTNIVFLLSIFQNVIISSVNHAGLPFHGSLLESRPFCTGAMMSIIFCIAITLEVRPSINKLLQLAPMSSQYFQIFVISLFLFDGVSAVLADRLCIYFLDKQLWIELQKMKKSEPMHDSEYAADIEESLLHSTRQRNSNFIQRMATLSVIFLMFNFYKQ